MNGDEYYQISHKEYNDIKSSDDANIIINNIRYLRNTSTHKKDV